MASNWVSFCAISCTHCPHQSERALARLIEELHIRKPQVFVHCGDVVDADSASVHSDDSDSVSLHDEFLIASDMLRRIREALPEDCKLVLLDGNHDDNIQRPDPRRTPKQLRDLCNPRKMHGVADEYNRWKNVKYRFGNCFQLGSVIFHHGFGASANSDELEAIQLAMACGGHAHRLVIRGHTHRPVPPTQCRRTARVKLPFWYCNVGMMAFEKLPSYAYRFDTQQWGRGACFGTAKIGRADRIPKDSWTAELVDLDS